MITGIGAVFFRALIGLIHNVAFFGAFFINYDANVFTRPSPWGALIILVPVAGGLIVTFLVQNFVPEARGHGVPEVMDGIYFREGIAKCELALAQGKKKWDRRQTERDKEAKREVGEAMRQFRHR